MTVYFFNEETQKVDSFSCEKIFIGTDHILAASNNAEEDKEIPIFLTLFVEQ